jgi:hypothetical protein
MTDQAPAAADDGAAETIAEPPNKVSTFTLDSAGHSTAPPPSPAATTPLPDSIPPLADPAVAAGGVAVGPAMPATGAPPTPLSVPELARRGSDRELTTATALFGLRKNEGIIYAALYDLAVREGTDNQDGTWTVQVGYKTICELSARSKRSLGRAWPRLLRWGFLAARSEHQDRVSTVYVVRSPESLDSMYKDAGITHYRILRGGKVQPFRPKPGVAEEL